MFEAHQSFAWYFGHFHINREFLIGKTQFRCLAEMAAFDVVSQRAEEEAPDELKTPKTEPIPQCDSLRLWN
jgi:hypothetical protein